MDTPERAKGPYIVWENYGYEGWKPTSFESITAALIYQKYSPEWVITKVVNYEIKEKENE